jgi:hypothetical protein
MQKQTMNQEQALGVLIQAAKVGQSKGAYSLEDAEVIAKAIRVFTPPADPKVAEVKESAGEQEKVETKN